jgi:hypothetical protein
MFGSKKMKRAKTKAFSSDKERKRFFAIKGEYAKSEGKERMNERWKEGK